MKIMAFMVLLLNPKYLFEYFFIINNPWASPEVLNGINLVSDPRVGVLNHFINKSSF
jgi:hypothetical protein